MCPQRHSAALDLGHVSSAGGQPSPIVHAAAMFCICALLFSLTAATTVQGADAAEFMWLSAQGGVAHPPGYPWFILLLQGAQLLPFGSVVWKASLVSALLASGAVAILAYTVHRASGSALAGFVGAALLALSPTFWQYATVPEVFTAAVFLELVILATVTGLTLDWVSKERGAAILGLTLGFAVAHHHTVVFLAPIIGYGLWLSVRAPKTLGITALATLPGLSGYGLLMLSGGEWRWGTTHTVSGLWRHFLRTDFGSFQLSAGAEQGFAAENVLAWAGASLQGFVGVFALMAILGAFRLRSFVPNRGYLVALVASFLLVGPVFSTLFGLEPVGVVRVLLGRFYLLSDAILALLAGMGSAAVLTLRPRLAPPLLLLGLLLHGASSAAQSPSHAGWTVLDDYGRGALESLPPNAVFMVSGDAFVFPLHYLNEVEQVRPDVTVVAPGMLGFGWYRARFDDELLLRGVTGFSIPKNSASVGQQNLHRPLFLNFALAEKPGLTTSFPPLVPSAGALLQVWTSDQAPPPPSAVEHSLEEGLLSHPFRSRPKTTHQWELTWEARAYLEYAKAFESLAGAYQAQGSLDRAAHVRARAAEFRPGSERPGQEGPE